MFSQMIKYCEPEESFQQRETKSLLELNARGESCQKRETEINLSLMPAKMRKGVPQS
jgi:hypothetical protein